MLNFQSQAIKIGVVGETNVGKTQFINNCLRKIDHIRQTQVFNVRQGAYECGDGSFSRLFLWDFSGKNQDIHKVQDAVAFLKQMDAIIIMYDITDFNSFQGVEKWVKILKKKAIISQLFYLVGNKLDLINQKKRKISIQKGQQKASCLGLPQVNFRQISGRQHSGKQFFDDIISSIQNKRYIKNMERSRFKISIVVQQKRNNMECQNCQKCIIF